VSIPGARSIHQHAPFRVVYCGRLWEHQKRISLVTQTLIKACRLKDVKIQATLIGEGYCKADCEQVVSEAGLTGRISFLGRQSFARIQAELLQSQAILLMSDFEGLPVALLEAMAVGVVPVTRSIPSGIPELVRHRETGLLTTEHPDDAAAAIGTLARDRHLWNHCSNQARALVLESFNQDRSHNSWYILLKNLQEKAEIKYPISSFHGVRLSRLSPFLQGAHHKPPFWRSKKLAQGLNMGMAILKGKLKKVLKPSA
ncbi:MAG: glycosyltransferase, partial [Cyanobacteriota bacterium]